MARVVAKSINKSFKSKRTTVRAVNDANVDICDGEFMVFVGPSGSGKSTFLRLIAGLELPTSGQLFIGDRKVTTMHPRARGVAMVFQDYALYPHMSVRENMSFALQNLKYPRKVVEERVSRAAAMLQIKELLERRPRELSGGQRQRVALGRAIVREPHAFLFDEPLSNLDAALRVQMRIELAELHRQLGTTSVYVTHDQVEAMTLGERIVVMHEGSIQQVGKGTELYNEPANTFVARFIGSPPMNVLSARLIGNGDGLALSRGTAHLDLPPGLTTRYARYLDQEVLFGIRAEDIVTNSQPVIGSNGWQPADVQVLLVEDLGSDKHVYFNFEGERMVARMPVDAVLTNGREGTPLMLNLNRVRLFDFQSGVAL